MFLVPRLEVIIPSSSFFGKLQIEQSTQEVKLARFEVGQLPPKRRKHLAERHQALKNLVETYDPVNVLGYLRKVAAFMKLHV